MTSYKEFKLDLIFGSIACLILYLAMNLLEIGYDSTDDNWRSGLGLYTDAMTGCQYLSAGGSGITPRVDRAGKHICGASQ